MGGTYSNSNSNSNKSSNSKTSRMNNGHGHGHGHSHGHVHVHAGSRGNSSKSYISDLDLESGEMDVIGEGSSSSSREEELKRIAGLKKPQHKHDHDHVHQTIDAATSELYVSADFAFASISNGNNKNSSNYSNKKRRNRNRKNDSTTNNSNETASFSGSTSVMMDQQRAVTKLVYIVLLCMALILSIATYLFVRHSEYKEFESEFRSYARETADLAETNAEHTFSQLETLSATITSEGLLQSREARTRRDRKRQRHERDRERKYKRELVQSLGSVFEDEDGKNEEELELYDSSIGSWPNVTIPHFDQRIENLSKSAGAIMILYVPLVQLKDKDEWERYANHYKPWTKGSSSSSSSSSMTMQTLDVNLDSGEEEEYDNNYYDDDEIINGTFSTRENGEGEKEVISFSGSNIATTDYFSNHNHGSNSSSMTSYPDDNYIRIRPATHLQFNETREGFNDVDSFMADVLRKQGRFSNPEGMVAPIYQYVCLDNHNKHNNHSEISLTDMLSHPILKKEMIASIEYDVPVISEYLDVDFLRDALSMEASSSSQDGSTPSYDCDFDDDNASRHLTLPCVISLTLDPVKESFEPDAKTIGFVVGVVPWSTYFRNVLKGAGRVGRSSNDDEISKEVNGIVVKVVSDCGSIFTYVLNSDKRKSKAQLGDWKEQYSKYEYLEQNSRFFVKHHPKGQSRHCHFDLYIYPNEEFRAMYRTNDPWLYALVVAGIFLFTAGLFTCYDAFVFKRQRHIVNEATGMIVENARRAARNERDLNDFIAHEVRNPLAAAISACAFVSSAITEDKQRRDDDDEDDDLERMALISSDEKHKEVQDDIKIIDSSLHFINDLLRNMLDMTRAGSNQIHIENKPTDIMDDIFKPVEAMMHLRDVPFKVILECSSSQNGFDEDNQLAVMTDPLRLKQVLLNLTRNATRFVENGFVRCGAKVNPIDGLVELYVDDSGPGIPAEKRQQVFGKFQQRLDSLQQGTGIGLSLCKKMIDLMGGCLYIDDDYRSGIEGCPGTRFVIQLKIPPLQYNTILDDHDQISRHDRARRLRKQLSCSQSSSMKRSLSSPSLTTLTESNNPPKNTVNDNPTMISASSASTETTLSLNESGADCLLKDYNANTIDQALDGFGVIKEEEQPSTILPPPAALPSNSRQVTIDDTVATVKGEQQSRSLLTDLPKNLSVLFVDDDMILRKLFSRTLKKINPSWTFQEASSGETAIELITSQVEGRKEFEVSDGDGDSDSNKGFNLIFMDQYMASVQKQLLGTETVRAIRAKGFHEPIICGLSANDVEDAFHHAGSDAFMFKPFPCKQEELKKELLRIINTRRRQPFPRQTRGTQKGAVIVGYQQHPSPTVN